MSRLIRWAGEILACVVAASGFGAVVRGAEPAMESVRRIWDAAPHNAFTDLVRFQDRWYCVFREGQAHVSPDGALRVIRSVDGEAWESAARIASPNSDLRDAKITVMPDGRLMLAGAEALHHPTPHKHQSLVWFSKDGLEWSERHEIGDRDNWLWRITWHERTAFGFGYGCADTNRGIRLYSSSDGRSFRKLIEKVDVPGTYPNETSMVFLPNGTCHCLLRQDGKPNTAFLGTSRPPFDTWAWRDLGVRIGGPHMIRLPDGRLFAVVRLYDKAARTSLCEVDPDSARLTERLSFPSGGDTSYAGLVWHADRLWISYYSSHEEKTAIYLAKVKLP